MNPAIRILLRAWIHLIDSANRANPLETLATLDAISVLVGAIMWADDSRNVYHDNPPAKVLRYKGNGKARH